MFGRLRKSSITALLLAAILVFPWLTSAAGDKKRGIPEAPASLWQPRDISSLDLFYGQGNVARLPQGPFKYLKKSNGGTQRKFVVEDARKIKWKVKLGEEAKPEIVATRLLWAAGYYADETYYLPMLKIDERVSQFQKDFGFSSNYIKGVRLERQQKEDKVATWDWFNNPFINSREFNGLRVMMALLNNWDLKEVDNIVYYDEKSDELRFYVGDLGASFGKSGNLFRRSKNNLKDYRSTRFIERVTADQVDFEMDTRPPFFVYIIYPYYREFADMGKIVKRIPRAHARWMGEQLAKLSDEQLLDAFRAADYEGREAKEFVSILRSRINELCKL